MVKISDYILDSLAVAGAKHVFFVPGGAAMHLNDSLAGSSCLSRSCFFHEQAAAVAAEAFAKISNRLGVAMVTAGPGSTNAITGVASAWVNSAPLVVISGQVKNADLNPGTLRQLGLQEIDIISLVRPITKYAATIVEPNSVRAHLEEAVFQATTGRPGPVWLSIPLDIQAALVDPSRQKGRERLDFVKKGKGDSLFWETIISKLNQAQRPVCLAGYGIRVAQSEGLLLQLAELLQMPVQTTWIGCDLLDSQHPLYAGRPGSFASRAANFAIQNSDLVLSIGCRLDFATTGYSRERFAREAFKIAVDVDPEEIRKLGQTIHLGLEMDARTFIEGLLERSDLIRSPNRKPWMQKIRSWETRYPIQPPAGLASAKKTVSTYQLVKSLSENLEDNDVVVEGSSGIHSEIFFMSFEVKAGQRVIADGSFGSMGYGLPASIGACIAAGRRRTILVEGDGSLQPQLQELETVRRENLPLKIFIVNNGGFASIRVSQYRYFNRLIGADASSGLTLPRLDRVASCYGIPFFCVDDEGTLTKQIQEVLNVPGPALCEVLVPPEEDRVPRLANFQRPDGVMVSRPMEDMFPFLERSELLENMIVAPIKEESL